MLLNWLLLSLAPFAATAQVGGAWTWLNDDLAHLEAQQLAINSALAALPAPPSPQTHERSGFHSGFAPKADSARWVQVDLGAEFPLQAVVIVPALLGASEAYGFPRRFRVDASNDPLFADSITLLDQSIPDVSPSLAPWHLEANNVKARYIRFTATKLTPQPGLSSRFIFCLGELMVFSSGRNIALQSKVFAPNTAETLPTWSPRHLVDGTHALGLPIQVNSTKNHSNGWHSNIASSSNTIKWVQIDLATKRPLDEIRLIPAHPSDYPDRFGFGFPRRFKIEADAQILFDSTTSDFPNPGDTAVAIPTPGLHTQTLRITATQLWERSGDFVFALAELQAFSGTQNIALGSSVTCSDETLTASWKSENLVDGETNHGTLIDEAQWLKALSKRRELSATLNSIALTQVAALNLAHTRASWLIGILCIGAALSAAFAIQHSRRTRKREIENLRQRISRDLHDEIGSHLGSIRLMSELALRQGDASESLDEIHRLAGEAAESMRGIIWLVREGDSPKLTSLVEAIRQSASSLLIGIDWTLDASTINHSTTASLEFHRQIFLFFREAAHNIARHAHATTVQIVVATQSNHLHLSIKDNGAGFDSNLVASGNGLSNLRHRAERLKGSLSLTSTPDLGTQITLVSPLS